MSDEQNQYSELETVFIKDEIAKCEDIDDLRKIVFPKIHTQPNELVKKIWLIANSRSIIPIWGCIYLIRIYVPPIFAMKEGNGNE